MSEVQARSPVGERTLPDHPLVAMLIAILLFAAATSLAIFVTSMLSPMRHGLGEAVKAAVTVTFGFTAYKVAIRHLGRDPHDDLPKRGAISNIGLGVAVGAGLFSLIVGVAALLGAYRISGCCDTTDFVSDLALSAIMPAFMEELLFRGILFRWIEEFAGSWAALIVSSVLFGLAHSMNPGSSWLATGFIALEAGMLLGGAYMLTRSLWMPMGLHAAWNFTQGFLFDVNVSGVEEHGLITAKLSGPPLITGGDFGLEASILSLLLATMAGILLVLLAVRRGKLVPPTWTKRRTLSSE
jgi:membrane protease YdiL (CAAX protease family)